MAEAISAGLSTALANHFIYCMKMTRIQFGRGIHKHVNIRMCVHWGKKYTPTNSLLQLSARIFLYYKIHKTLLKLIPSPWSFFFFFFFFLPWYWTRCKAPTISLMGAKNHPPSTDPPSVPPLPQFQVSVCYLLAKMCDSIL